MRSRSDLIIVANRLPVRRRRRGGEEIWDESPGGLVAALMPILRRRGAEGLGGAWVGWSGSRTRSFEPFTHEGVRSVPVNLGRKEVEGYYDGMANSTLWPLYHDVVRKPKYEERWWEAYRGVNRAFARAAAESAARGAHVWVHDYHLHLVPGLLREMRSDLRIGFFLHIPFPDTRLFAQLPWRREIVRGTLGADVIGTQTRGDAERFVAAAARFCPEDETGGALRVGERPVSVDAYPISIDASCIDQLAQRPDIRRAAQRIRRRLGDRTVLLGVDRADYTKGIPHRLRAFQALLSEERLDPHRVVLVQTCVPTRDHVGVYARLRSEIEELVGQINGQYAEVGMGCVHYLRQNLGLDKLVALYLAADVALVTSLRDGMNLVAKEFVASRHDETGALVLSEHAGAAAELVEALIVNPFDAEAMKRVFVRAIEMSPEEARERMRAMRRTVMTHDVYAWADAFVQRLDAGAEGGAGLPTDTPAPTVLGLTATTSRTIERLE